MRRSGILDGLLSYLITKGALVVIDASGQRRTFGDQSAEPVIIRLTDKHVEWEIGLNPRLKFGEAYMQGRLVLERGDIYDLIALLVENAASKPAPALVSLIDATRKTFRAWEQRNPLPRSRKNVAHHYDIDGRIYDLFLDAQRHYSCAYFADQNSTLDEAQKAKVRHIAAKLNLKDGLRILDIGSGWGGLSLYLAKIANAKVTGITLSEEQLKLSRERTKSSGLQDQVEFQARDYREVTGTFDRIVSVGMFEHVGIGHYKEYFDKISETLAVDGVALVHTIGRSSTPTATNAFTAKYIFPGGYAPALSEILSAIEQSGLIVTDIEILRLHYAETLRQWRERFSKNRFRAAALKGEAFCRMWEFYLAGAEAAFRYEGMVVFQIQLTKRLDALPLTRDYAFRGEEVLKQQEMAMQQRSGQSRLAS